MNSSPESVNGGWDAPLATIPGALLAGWAVGFLTLGATPAGAVLVVGSVAVGAALALGGLAFYCASRLDFGKGAQGWRRHLAGLGALSVVILATGAWVWLQYGLNPYRVRPVLDALLVSRALPWQITCGLLLYGTIVSRARRPLPAAPASPRANGTGPHLSRLTVRMGDSIHLIAADTVERLQGWDDYVALFAGGRRHLASYRLTDLARRLDPERFVRIHRSHLVNLGFVEKVEREGSRVRVRMRNGELIPASRTGAVQLRRLMRQEGTFLILLLSLLPVPVFAQPRHPPPVLPRYLEGACQGEDCGFDYRAVVCRRLDLRSGDSLSAPVIARLEPGDTATVMTGNLRVRSPGIVVLLRDTLLATDDGEPRLDTLRLVKGDTLFVLEYRQLGAWTWWYRGRLTDGIEFWNGPGQRYFGRGRDSLPAWSPVESLVETWLRLTGPRGQKGWWLWKGEDWARVDWGENCNGG